MSGPIQLLQLAGLAAGTVAIVVYGLVVLKRPEWARLLNGSGLFFTGLALYQTPTLLRGTQGRPGASAVALIALMMLAALAQSAVALRNRKAWDGVERRRAGELELQS